MRILKSIIFIFSILLNLWFFLGWINIPSNRLGVLTKDVRVQIDDKTYITLPKGLTVKDASPQGLNAIGQFEKYRFSIIITSDSSKLVNFNVDKNFLRYDGSLYHGI